MVIRVFDHEVQAGQAAAMLVAAQIIRKPDSVIGLATGSSPLQAYQELVRMYQAGIVDWSRVITFNLDEYHGLSPDHSQSYRSFMLKHLFGKINMQPEAIHVPNGTAANPAEECLAYERAIRAAGGIDLQLLGLGRNGHIGFNEPGSSFSTLTHVVNLTEDTADANARFFDKMTDVPKQALSMGVGTIMQARQIIMLVTGSGKARAVSGMVNGAIDPKCPGSILQIHANVTVLLDCAAATALNR